MVRAVECSAVYSVVRFVGYFVMLAVECFEEHFVVYSGERSLECSVKDFLR